MEQNRRLIDADALKASFDARYDSAFMQMHTRDNKEYWDGVCAGVNWGRNTIADASTVDAVEVVRCNDCKWFKKGAPFRHECKKINGGMLFLVQPDDFCSHGERRDNG